ncbi:fatty acid desaturase family protein [Streptomyces sp. NPDC056821]|uniref:fatty acid desaturase family protein n=1 Tax=unclassified Streptomyces TaxID=2593676 RepID=UPI0036808B60
MPLYAVQSIAPEALVDVESFGRELDALRREVLAERGAEDVRYIRTLIAVQRGLEAGGRAALAVSLLPPAWLAGTAMLTVAKVLENMELGHNILHGQWDWMRDPAIHSTTWEWDFPTPSAAWKHTHNDLHHTWTNVVGRDRDLGYTILRMSADQPWHPTHLAQPLYAAAIAPVFEWTIALYDLEHDAVLDGRKPLRVFLGDLTDMLRKAARQGGLRSLVLRAVGQPVAGAVCCACLRDARHVRGYTLCRCFLGEAFRAGDFFAVFRFVVFVAVVGGLETSALLWPRAVRALSTDCCSAAMRSTRWPGWAAGCGASGSRRCSCLASTTSRRAWV